jgi:hypothetical protein
MNSPIINFAMLLRKKSHSTSLFDYDQSFGSLRILPRKNLRLDGGIFRVTPAADDWHPWLGMTWRF